MVKMMKRMMALVIALSMLTGVVVMPTAAEDTVPGTETTVTVKITNDKGEVIGEKVITTVTETTETPTDFQKETKSESTWTSQETESTPSTTVTEGTTTTDSSKTVVTDVSGSETSTDKIDSDKKTGVQIYSGSDSGSEDTTITDTTTTVTTTTGVVEIQKTEGPETIVKDKVEEEEWSGLIPGEEGDWVKTVDQNEGFKPVPGSKETGSTTSAPIDVDNNPLDNGDVTLTMTAPTGSTPSTDEQELYISIEDALKNDIAYKDGETLADGSTVTYQYDGSGNVTGYTIKKITPTGSTSGQIIPGTTGEAVKSGEEVKTYTKPDGYTVMTDEPILDAEGKQIGTKTVEEIKDLSGNVIGYTITEKINGTTGAEETTKELPTPETTYTLPQRPEAPAPVTKDGLTTTVTVEDITDGEGNIIGYTTVKTVTDENGAEVSVESESIYGTSTSKTSTLTTTPTTDEVVTTTVTTVYGTLTTQNYTKTTPGTQTTVATQDVSEDIYELVETENGLYFLYQGKMYEVQSITSGNKDDYSHGDKTITSLQPNIEDLEPGTYDGYVDSTTLLRNPENFTVSKDKAGIAEGFELEYVGYGLETAIQVDKNFETTAGQVLAHQFKLVDKEGNYHYVLCADLGINAKRGADYKIVNVDDADYYVRDGAAEKIEAIALNGYWGTDSGVGSLDNVKTVLENWLKANTQLSEEQIEAQVNALQPGEALTATQAAIWYYGNSNENKTMNATAITGDVYKSNNTLRDATTGEATRVNNLYQALLALDSSSVTNNTTELLDTDNFATETKLVIREKATDNSGNVKTYTTGSNEEKEVYLADLSFTVDVKKSDLTGNLIVTITDTDGNELHKPIQIATAESGLIGKFLASESTDSTDIVLKDLELPEGTTFNLNLSGIQNLEQGAYLYTAAVYSDSQTFVGVASGTREVNLNVQMEFNVTDPQAKVQHTGTTWQEKQENTDSYTKVDHFYKEKKGTSTTQTKSVSTTVVNTTVQTDVTVLETDAHREWWSSYQYELVDVDDEDKKDNDKPDDKPEDKKDDKKDEDKPEDKKDDDKPDNSKHYDNVSWNDDGLVDILDEEVPLANAPKTGDASILLGIISLFSLGGMMVLKKKED